MVFIPHRSSFLSSSLPASPGSSCPSCSSSLYMRVSANSEPPEPPKGIVLLFMHVSQRWCILLVPPHTGHLHRLLTSLSAFPAICLCLFLECDVFFLGTAFKMPSQIPSSMSGMDGRFREMAGTASEYLGRNGSDICLMYRNVNLYEERNVGEASRGRKEEAARVGNIAPAMLAIFDREARCLRGVVDTAWEFIDWAAYTTGDGMDIGFGAAGARQSICCHWGADVVLSRYLVRPVVPSSRKITSATLPSKSCFPRPKTARGRCQ